MTIECCGNELKTNFCPMCGKRRGKPIDGLRAHITTTVAALITSVATTKRDIANAESDKSKEFLLRRLEKQVRSRDKWQSWLEVLSDRSGTND